MCVSFDYGNAEVDGGVFGNGTMEAIYFGCGDGRPPLPACEDKGPWVMADMECMHDMLKILKPVPMVPVNFVVAMVKGAPNRLVIKRGDGQQAGSLLTLYDGERPSGWQRMRKQGAIVLGIGGDNSPWGAGTFYEGAITRGFVSDDTDDAVMADVVAAGYDLRTTSDTPLRDTFCQDYWALQSPPAPSCEEVQAHVRANHSRALPTLELGSPANAPLLFLHGWPDTAAMWANQMAALCYGPQARFYCLATTMTDFHPDFAPAIMEPHPWTKLGFQHQVANIAAVELEMPLSKKGLV